jgi:hypothetical protein
MNAEQKRAWLAVISSVICVVLYVVLAVFVRPDVATCAFAVLAVNGFAVFIGRRERLDERDTTIARRATLLGFAASYLAFVLALTGEWIVMYLVRGNSQVSIHVLPTFVFFGFMIVYFVRAIALLISYRRHSEADNV